jgi:hypothetical protein
MTKSERDKRLAETGRGEASPTDAEGSPISPKWGIPHSLGNHTCIYQVPPQRLLLLDRDDAGLERNRRRIEQNVGELEVVSSSLRLCHKVSQHVGGVDLL